jgi:hypothetical protein
MARHSSPGQIEALAAFARQLEAIRQLFVDVDRQDMRAALYGVDVRRPTATSISIDDWGTLLCAVKTRLRLAASGEANGPGVNGTPATLQASVLECVDALDQLHVMLGDALSAQAQTEWRNTHISEATGERLLAAYVHASAVPALSIPPLANACAEVASDR